MNSIVTEGYRSINAKYQKGGHREPFVIIQRIPNHKNGYFVRRNMVALKYLDFKKNADLNVDVRVFNFITKANAKTSKKYIINAFNYMLRDMALDWCHNYMLRFLDCTFSELTQTFRKRHHKTQNDEKIYMELKNMKHEEIKRVEVYYEQI